MTIDYWLADAKFLFLGHRNLTAKDDFPILDKIVAFQIRAIGRSSVNQEGKHLYTVKRWLWFWFLTAVTQLVLIVQGCKRGWEWKAPPRGGGLKLLQCFYRVQEGTIYICSLAAHPKGTTTFATLWEWMVCAWHTHRLRQQGEQWLSMWATRERNSQDRLIRRQSAGRGLISTGCWQSSDSAFLPCWAQHFLSLYHQVKHRDNTQTAQRPTLDNIRATQYCQWIIN